MSLVACGRDRKADALDVLCDAFHDYPVMRYVLADAGAAYDSQLRRLIDFFCEARLTRRMPMYAKEVDGQFAAVALVSPPAEGDIPAELARCYDDLIAVLGQAADTRMECYEAACEEAGDPGTPSHYLGVLGVASTHQRQGYGQQLVERAKQLVREDATSATTSNSDLWLLVKPMPNTYTRGRCSGPPIEPAETAGATVCT